MILQATVQTKTASSSIKTVTTLDEFMRLKPLWDKYLESVQSYAPFFCHDWFKLWLDHFYENQTLLILLLFEENELVAIAPLQITSDTLRGVTVRTVSLIGNVYSPIRYFLLRPYDDERKIGLIVRIFDFFRSQFCDWDVMDLYPIAEEDGAFVVLKEAVRQSGLHYDDAFAFGDQYLDGINFSGDDYFNSLPKKIRKDVPYCKRRLMKNGELEFKVVTTPDMIDLSMDHYYEVYSKSWQQSEGVGPTFHRDLAKMAAAKGWLRLGILFFNKAPIASQFWLYCNSYAYILKTAYDQEFKKYSPGKILTVEMMKYVIDVDKVASIDYLHGDESYKKDWTSKRRERKQILVYNNNMKGRYLNLITSFILPVVNKNRYLRKVKEFISLRLSRTINH